MCKECKALLKAIDNYIDGVDNDLTDELAEEGYAEPSVTLKYARQIEEEVADALVEETDYFVMEAEKAVDLDTFAADIWPKVKVTDALKGKLATVFTERLGEFMPEFVGYYLAQAEHDLTLQQVSQRTTAWVKSWSHDLADIMQLNSHKEIETILTMGLKEGHGIAEFTRAIQESGIRDEYLKARRVAVTEVLTAHRAAQQEAFMQSPATEYKKWRHTGAYRNQPRENHVEMDGQIVPKASTYVLHGIRGGTYYPMFPGDPILPPEERINCHCISQGIASEDVLGMSLEEREQLQQEAVDRMDDEWERELDAKNKAKAGIKAPPSSRDVTRAYSKGAKPGQGTITRQPGYKAKSHRDEIKIADTIKEKFGGDLILLTEDGGSGVKTADYIWRGAYWELKSPHSISGGDGLLRTAAAQIERQPGGVIMDYQGDAVDFAEARKILFERFRRKDFRLDTLDVMIFHQGKFRSAIRFEK